MQSIHNVPDFEVSGIESEKLRDAEDDILPPSPDTQKLLTALRDFVISLAQDIEPSGSKGKNLEMLQGPQTDAFLLALKTYVTSIVKDLAESDAQKVTTMTVSLEDIVQEAPPRDATLNVHMDSLKRGPAVILRESEATSTPTPRINIRARPIESLPESATSLEDYTANMLTHLHNYIYNKMPLRLLHFEKREGSKFHISLLERSEIYTYLKTQLTTQYMATDHQRRNVFEYEFYSDISAHANYAILSHTWLRSDFAEVTYDDWRKGRIKVNQPGYQKIVNFGQVALEDHNISLCWMDTICIDKSSSSELDESIRSMYKWYANASLCIAYLSASASIGDMALDPWFTRGWTLQELLAPRRLKFYGYDWKMLSWAPTNDKLDQQMCQQIFAATTITAEEVQYPFSVSISRRMKWAAVRKVTREEDIVYSLMGLFGVNMSIAYGEGAELAFTRLVREIRNTSKSDIFEILNWNGSVFRSQISTLLPTSPRAYLTCNEFNFWRTKLIEPLVLTHLGLRIPVVILPAMEVETLTSTPVAQEFKSVGDYYATVHRVLEIRSPVGEWLDGGRQRFTHYNALDIRAFDRSLTKAFRHGLAVLNCSMDAVAFKYRGDLLVDPLTSKVPVGNVTFKLHKKTDWKGQNSRDAYYSIKRTKLANHGMQFISMYF